MCAHRYHPPADSLSDLVSLRLMMTRVGDPGTSSVFLLLCHCAIFFGDDTVCDIFPEDPFRLHSDPGCLHACVFLRFVGPCGIAADRHVTDGLWACGRAAVMSVSNVESCGRPVTVGT